MRSTATPRIHVPPQISDARRARNVAIAEVDVPVRGDYDLPPYQRKPQNIVTTELDTASLRSYKPPSQRIPGKRSRTDVDDHHNPYVPPHHERHNQPPQKRQRHIPNSFYNTSPTARFGIIPATARCTLAHMAHLGKTGTAIGVCVCKHVSRVCRGICRGIPRYVRDLHRAGVVRGVFGDGGIGGGGRGEDGEGVEGVVPGDAQQGKGVVDAGTRSEKREVDDVIRKGEMGGERRRGTIFTPFSGDELRALRCRKRDARNAKTSKPTGKPTPPTTRCPLCHFDTPSTSPFCTTCLNPCPPGPAPKSHARSIVSYDKSPDIYTSPGDGQQATLLTYTSNQDPDEDYLCTGGAGPPGTITPSDTHVTITRDERRRLLRAREQAWENDSLGEAREQERREMARQNGVQIPKGNAPYFSDVQEENATREALSLHRNAEVERAWMLRLAGYRKEAEDDKTSFPLNVPGYELLEDAEVTRLEGDAEVLDGWMASMGYTDIPPFPKSGAGGDKKTPLTSKRLAARTKRLKAIQQREADRQYLEHIADLQRQALSMRYEFPEGVPGWREVHHSEQQRILWAAYTNQVNATSKKRRKKARRGSRNSNTITTPEKQARKERYTFLKEKLEQPYWEERVRETGESRSAILRAGGRWPGDATYEDDDDEELKELTGLITEFLELKEEFGDQ